MIDSVLFEGQGAKEHLNHEHSHAPQVSTSVIPVILHHLVGVVARGASATLVRLINHANSKAKVTEVDPEVRVDHDILRLDVPVDDTA